VTVQNGSAPPPSRRVVHQPGRRRHVAGRHRWPRRQRQRYHPYRLTVDGAQVFSTTTSATSASFSWNTTTVANGSHTLGLTVTDSQSGSASASRSVTAQNAATPPPLTASFTSPAAGATVAGTVTVGLAASGGTAPYTYRLTVDGAQVFSTTTSATTASFAWNSTTVANGSHALGLTVTDSASGSASATRGVTVSNTSTGTLRVALTTPTPGSTVSGTVWVNIWVEGAAAGSNAYTMTVGGSTVWTQSSTDVPTALGHHQHAERPAHAGRDRA
jgi:Ca2+-dependent lipid-binding protein